MKRRNQCRMEIRAYPVFYLAEAKRHLGACTDYLVNVCGVPADRVGDLYGACGEKNVSTRKMGTVF